MNLTSAYIPFAEAARKAIYDRIDNSGYLRNVCAIDDERKMRDMSPEGQSMVLMMEAAATDWQMARWQ